MRTERGWENEKVYHVPNYFLTTFMRNYNLKWIMNGLVENYILGALFILFGELCCTYL